MRLNKNQLDRVKKRFNVDRIWSYSRLATNHNCIWDYWAHYIEHMKFDSSNAYTEFGTFSHDDIQAANAGEIDRTEMIKRWKDFIEQWSHDPKAHRFDSDKIKLGYINNLDHYYYNTDLLCQNGAKEIRNEVPVMTLIDNAKYVFVGYIDTEYSDEEGNIVLVDYKTSSKSSFSKAHLPEKSEQLLLYSLGVHQITGTPFEKIKARFDMMKYVTVHYKQENGKWNTSIQERRVWVSKMAKKLTTKLKKLDMAPEKIDEMVTIAGLNNNMDNIPEEVRSQFYTTNYYIELDVSEENIKKVADKVAHECKEIVDFEHMPKDDQISYMEVNHPYDESNYYDTHLCAYHCSDYFKQREGIKEDDAQDELDAMFVNDSSNSEADTILEDVFS